MVWLVSAALLTLAASLLLSGGSTQAKRDRTGLFTSLPILWNESADLAGMLKPQQAEHWARPLIAGGGEIAPLDTLSAASLKGLKYLVMAQPRPLAPDENVALDAWVRGGGKLLLLADPMLTEATIFPLGDKRRPQDVALLDPILRHWGLALDFEAEQAAGEQVVEILGIQFPVNLPGIAMIDEDSGNCDDHADGDQSVYAICRIGQGRVLLLADAAVLEREDATGTRAKALKALLETAFGPARH